MNVCEHLTCNAQLFPNKDAIVFEGESYTFAELNLRSQRAARILADAGVQRSDRVALMLPNVPAFAVWYYAVLRLGAIAVSVSTRLTEQEVAFILSDCAAKAFVTNSATLALSPTADAPVTAQNIQVSESGDVGNCESWDQAPTDTSTWFNADPDEPAVILYTSGTTGFAKGATLSHMNVRSNAHAFNHLCEMRTDDRILLSVPLFHCFGQNALLNSAFNVAATIVLQRTFDVNEARRLIRDLQVTQLYGVPTIFQLLHDTCQPEDLASVRYCFSAAAKLPTQVSQRWQEKFGQPIYEGYGLTETSPFASYNHRLKYVLGSIGTPIDAVEMKIVDTETGATCESGQLGEIAIRGPNVMLGYWNRPEETENVIRNGWFHSGDIGHTDEQGYFYIVDRVKDMISVGGLKVYPAEVEDVLLSHEAIADVAVVGLPDDLLEERVVAFVVQADQTTQPEAELSTDILQYARAKLARYKSPQQIIFLAELPRNASGKLLKKDLRAMDFVTSTAAQTEAPRDSVDRASSSATEPLSIKTLLERLNETYAVNRREVATDFLQQEVQSLTGSENLPDSECRFLDVGLDSLMAVELSRRLQQEIGAAEELPPTLIFDHPRICDLADYLVSNVEMNHSRALENGTEDQIPQQSVSGHFGSSKSRGRHLADRQAVASMTEDEALQELMREISEDADHSRGRT